MAAKKKNYHSVDVDSEFGNNFLDLSKLFSKKKGKSKKDEKKQSSSSTLFNVFLGIAILALLLILLIGGFSFGFFINLILWIGLLYIIKKGLFFGTGVLIIIGSILLIISFFSMGSGGDSVDLSKCDLGNFEKYDGKTLNVKGDNIEGKLTLKKQCGNVGFYSVYFSFVITDELETNCITEQKDICTPLCFEDRYEYLYIANIPRSEYTTAVFKQACNKGQVFAYGEENKCDNPEWAAESRHFEFSGSTSVTSYEELMAFNQMDIYSSSKYYEIINQEGDQTSCSANEEKILANEPIYKTYTWKYENLAIEEDVPIKSDLNDCKSIAAQNNIPSIEFEINNFDERIKKLRLGERSEYTYMSQYDECEESLDDCIDDSYTDLDNCRYNGGTECDIEYSVQRESCVLPVLKCELKMWQKEC